MKILYVDDSGAYIELAQQEFKKNPYGLLLDTCDGAQEALKKMQTKVYDAVITDVIMPIYDGLELAKMLQKKHPQVAVIICTSYEGLIELETYQGSLNIIGFLDKPPKPQDVMELLHDAKRLL